jgi:hypothetical protein
MGHLEAENWDCWKGDLVAACLELSSGIETKWALQNKSMFSK